MDDLPTSQQTQQFPIQLKLTDACQLPQWKDLFCVYIFYSGIIIDTISA